MPYNDVWVLREIPKGISKRGNNKKKGLFFNSLPPSYKFNWILDPYCLLFQHTQAETSLRHNSQYAFST